MNDVDIEEVWFQNIKEYNLVGIQQSILRKRSHRTVVPK